MGEDTAQEGGAAQEEGPDPRLPWFERRINAGLNPANNLHVNACSVCKFALTPAILQASGSNRRISWTNL
jgi:hypothetical protein